VGAVREIPERSGFGLCHGEEVFGLRRLPARLVLAISETGDLRHAGWHVADLLNAECVNVRQAMPSDPKLRGMG